LEAGKDRHPSLPLYTPEQQVTFWLRCAQSTSRGQKALAVKHGQSYFKNPASDPEASAGAEAAGSLLAVKEHQHLPVGSNSGAYRFRNMIQDWKYSSRTLRKQWSLAGEQGPGKRPVHNSSVVPLLSCAG